MLCAVLLCAIQHCGINAQPACRGTCCLLGSRAVLRAPARPACFTGLFPLPQRRLGCLCIDAPCSSMAPLPHVYNRLPLPLPAAAATRLPPAPLPSHGTALWLSGPSLQWRGAACCLASSPCPSGLRAGSWPSRPWAASSSGERVSSMAWPGWAACRCRNAHGCIQGLAADRSDVFVLPPHRPIPAASGWSSTSSHGASSSSWRLHARGRQSGTRRRGRARRCQVGPHIADATAR